ncbi:MAG: DNA primase [Candidatus Roizmanbacteria bacterium]|nr:DNA primase [Candidatus Roizmanbacteria bacterium]
MESAIEKLKERIDLVELIGSYVQLKKAGRNFKGICPFHQEKTPSFVVSPDRQLWRCFGSCGIGGDAIAFYMKYENLSFLEALTDLATRYGIVIEKMPVEDKIVHYKERLIKVNQVATDFYHYILTKSSIGKPALDYLKNRSISDKIIETFQLGYSPSSWDSLTRFLHTKKFENKELVDSGLCVQKQMGGSVYDRFRGRVMFPLKDHRGNTVGFSGRILSGDSEAKYVNTPETTLYHKRSMLFGLHLTKDAVKKENKIILVEGEFDVIMPFQQGVSAIAAIKGSALTTEQLQLIKRYTNRVYLALDADKAGEEAIRRAIEVAEPMGFELGVIVIDGGKDPDEAVRTNEIEFKKSLEHPIPVYDFLMQMFAKKYPPSDPFNKKQIGEEMAPFLYAITNPIVQSYYIKQLAKLLDVSEDAAGRVVRGYRKRHLIRPNKQEVQVKKPLRELVIQQFLLEQLLHAPSLTPYMTEIQNIITDDVFTAPSYGKLFTKLHEKAQEGGTFDINAFIKTLPAELASVADELYLKASSDEQSATNSIKHIALEIKRNALRSKLKNILNSASEADEEILKELQAQLKELEKMSSTV